MSFDVHHPAGLPYALASADRCLVMGILNVTPDSFSDGGRWARADEAVRRAEELVTEGADIVDVGGESTRPGAERTSPDEEIQRVVPVVRALARRGVPVSVDTMRSVTALRAIEAGACIVNDVSAGLADPRMPHAMASANVPYVAMHWRGHSARMDQQARYGDVVADVCAELLRRVEQLGAAGVDARRVALDPGLGFAKTREQDWALTAALADVVALGYPVLVGASRKRFLGTALAEVRGHDVEPSLRDAATAAVTTLAAMAGAWCVRVHSPRESSDAVAVCRALQSTQRQAPPRPVGSGHGARG